MKTRGEGEKEKKERKRSELHEMEICGNVICNGTIGGIAPGHEASEVCQSMKPKSQNATLKTKWRARIQRASRPQAILRLSIVNWNPGRHGVPGPRGNPMRSDTTRKDGRWAKQVNRKGTIDEGASEVEGKCDQQQVQGEMDCK